MSSPTTPLPGREIGGTWYARNWRWCVLATLFYATFLNYLDRQTLSVAMEPISREFDLDNRQRGELLAAFIFVYAFCHLFVGLVLDRIRSFRWFFPAMVLGWSAVTMAMAWSNSHQSLLWLRYLLGVFESVNFPLCYLIIARIFPPAQWALACGIFKSGAVAATLVAPKLVIYLSSVADWRVSFIFIGALGLTWVVPWLLIFRHPEKRSQFWPKPAVEGAVSRSGAEVREILGSRNFWGVLITGLAIVPGLYFTSQWLPSYFTQVWKLDYSQTLGNRLVLVYLMQDFGLWVGGGLSWWLSRRGLPVFRARKVVICGAFVLTMSMMFVPQLRSFEHAVVVLCVYVFGLGCWIANMGAFKQSVHRTRIGTVTAWVGFAETGFAAFIVARIGGFVQGHGGFDSVFLLLASFLVVGVCSVLFVLRDPFPSSDSRAEPVLEAASPNQRP